MVSSQQDKDLHVKILENNAVLLGWVGYSILIDIPQNIDEELENIDCVLLTGSATGDIKALLDNDKNKAMQIWLPEDNNLNLELNDKQSTTFKPNKKLEIFGLEVTPFIHNDSYAFRIGNALVYVKGVDNNNKEMLENVDTVLIGVDINGK